MEHTLIILGFIASAASLGIVALLLSRTGGFSSTLRDEVGRLDKALRDELARSRGENTDQAGKGREELSKAMNQLAESVRGQVGDLTRSNEERLGQMRDTMEKKLEAMAEKNNKELERMREVVDVKLHKTLETRLGESFRAVSDRLESVQKGLGEMQSLASGVGDLKKVLSNVKTRGGWGEVQLGAILEQMLIPEQYGRDVVTKPRGRDSVEFAIKLPGEGEGGPEQVWLPIDSKYPQADYERLIEAQENADVEGVEAARKALETFFKGEAKKIRDKYVSPPDTTDFAVMFVPLEGLYAELMRIPGLAQKLQEEYRVTAAGPTNLAALLNSLQMGFRTLAIQKRSGEVWSLLAAVKREFGRFGEMLESTEKSLQAASNHLKSVASKSRTIENKLKKVEEIPQSPQSGNGSTPAIESEKVEE